MQIILQGGKSMSKLDGGEGMGINMWMEKERGGQLHTLQGGPGGWLLLLEELDGSRGETGRAREWGGLIQQSLKWWLSGRGVAGSRGWKVCLVVRWHGERCDVGGKRCSSHGSCDLWPLQHFKSKCSQKSGVYYTFAS
ncbi:hypothetical protein BKA83DRAFT_4129129 [Pisolithus microcarpus]|nr:hypothetical protein BKA83DRAFT_4129129 [Pisolithus microcarpus]